MTVVLLSAAERLDARRLGEALEEIGPERGPFVLVTTATVRGDAPADVIVVPVHDPDARPGALRGRLLRRARRSRLGRALVRVLRGGRSRAYLRAVRTSGEARRALRSATAVVALDAMAHRAAWHVGRAHPTVLVVNGTSAIRRLEGLVP